MKYQVDESILQAILNYLVNKPYGEVAQLIASLQQGALPIQVSEDRNDG